MPRWTEEARSRQSDRIKEQRPWLAATGPVTPYGKLVASQNARKHRRCFQGARCVLAQEPVAECQSSVTVQQGIRVGDFVRYVGTDPAIASICSGKLLEVFQLVEGWARCWIPNFPGIMTVSIDDLERSPDG